MSRTIEQIVEEIRRRNVHVRIQPNLSYEEIWVDGKFYAWCSSRTLDIERLIQRCLDMTDDELAAFREHMAWRFETQFKGLMGDSH